MQVINDVFLDLDDCELESIGLKKIIEKQQVQLDSRQEILDFFKTMNSLNEEIRTQLEILASIHQQKFQKLFDQFKSQEKKQKRRTFLLGGGIAIGGFASFGYIIYQISQKK